MFSSYLSSIKSFEIALADLRKQLKLQLSVMDDAEAKEILRLTRLIEENELKAKLGEATEAYNIAQGKTKLDIKKDNKKGPKGPI